MPEQQMDEDAGVVGYQRQLCRPSDMWVKHMSRPAESHVSPPFPPLPSVQVLRRSTETGVEVRRLVGLAPGKPGLRQHGAVAVAVAVVVRASWGIVVVREHIADYRKHFGDLKGTSDRNARQNGSQSANVWVTSRARAPQETKFEEPKPQPPPGGGFVFGP